VRWNPETNRVEEPFALGEKIETHVLLYGGDVRPMLVRTRERP
jgi:hypothetical protein